MAISLRDINKSSSKNEKSLMDKILERREKRTRIKQKNSRMKKALRPWENANDVKMAKSEYSEEKLLKSIKIRAHQLFSNLDLRDL